MVNGDEATLTRKIDHMIKAAARESRSFIAAATDSSHMTRSQHTLFRFLVIGHYSLLISKRNIKTY